MQANDDAMTLAHMLMSPLPHRRTMSGVRGDGRLSGDVRLSVETLLHFPGNQSIQIRYKNLPKTGNIVHPNLSRKTAPKIIRKMFLLNL